MVRHNRLYWQQDLERGPKESPRIEEQKGKRTRIISERKEIIRGSSSCRISISGSSRIDIKENIIENTSDENRRDKGCG